MVLLPQHLAESLRDQDICRYDYEKEQRYDPAVIDRNPDRYDRADDTRNQNLDDVGVEPFHALDVFEKFTLDLTRFDFFVICDGKVLQLPYDGAPQPRARTPQHFIRDPRIDHVRRDVLQQDHRQHDGVDHDLPHGILRPHRHRIDDVRRDDRHDPDRRIFEDV